MSIANMIAKQILVVATVIWCGAVFAQDRYPTKVIHILTSEVGSGGDVSGRVIAQGISGPLGGQVIVDNRPGVVLVETVAKAPPDGYTLICYGGVIWLSPFLKNQVNWDPIKDFSPITLAARIPNIIVVQSSFPAKSISELIAVAKAKPGALNYGTGPSGSSTHLAAELFRTMAKIDITRIPYKGSPPANEALLAGEIQITFPAASEVLSMVKAGKLRILGVGSSQRYSFVPDVPTVAASGLPGYESNSLIGVLAPGGTPVPIIRRLNQEIVSLLNKPDVKDKMSSMGLEVSTDSPEQFGALIKSEMEKWSKVIKDAGIPKE